ncbi:MAG: phosphoribosylamine--glycine ligase [Planctomycetes bacterium]|nr:phosphoribosylamine--glycine ligase [Planctomycetota bacterium]
MKVLVIGGGGREHALAWKLKQSPRVDALFIAPGNPGTASLGTNVPIKATDIEKLAQFAVENRIDLTVVGPETPLVLGIVDEFQRRGLRAWGPSKAAATLEGSKVAMKEFLRRHNIPTAQFKIFNKAADAHAYIDELDGPSVVKCDGLAAGKGVTVARNAAEAHDAILRIMEKNEFGKEAGRNVVIEEVLKGEELSVFAFCDGRNAVLLDYCQDHKQVRDGDEGPNTGGMGAFSPVPGLLKPRDEDEMIRRILVPTMSGLVHEGRPYVGILYMGLMITDAGPKVIEYNVRFGDPECQALMMRLDTDLVEVCEACIAGHLDQVSLDWKDGVSICVTMAAKDYPSDAYARDLPITGLDSTEAQRAMVFHAGTGMGGGRLLSTGGRVLSVCALGATLDDARAQAYAACDAIQYEGKHFRRDIGKRREARKAR